jgi:uncharacterized protein (DUF2147 family)
MAKKTHIRLAAAVAALLSATPALADQITNFPGGYVHSWKGDHGEDFTVIHSNNTGQSTTTVDRHDGKGPLPFVPQKQKITKKFGGSVYDPTTGQTTTLIVGPNGRISGVENGNQLPNHDFWWPTDIKGHSAGTGFDPMTGKTTTIVMDPGMYGRMVEDGDHMRDHDDMVMDHHKAGKKMIGGAKGGAMVGGLMGGGAKPKKDWIAEGSAYDPDTGKTTSIVRGPKDSMSMVEDGNTLDRHAEMMRRMPHGHASGALYDPATNMTTALSQGPNGWARSVEMGNTLWAH